MKILTIIIIFAFSINIYAQDTYIVQNIKGNVKKGTNPLKKGDKISSSDKINFSKGSVMLVSSQKVGQMVLSPNGKTIQSEIAYTLNDLLPQSKRASTRSNIVLNNMLDFQNHFGTSTFRVYGDNYVVKVASSYNVMYTNEKSDRFFFFQMSHSSEKEPFNKHLQGVKNHLNFRKNEIFTISGKPIEPKETKFLGLYFYDKTANDFPKLADFQIEFVDDKPLVEATKSLVEMLNREKLDMNSYELFCNQVKDIADQIYGKVDKDGLEYWIENKLRIYRPLK